MGEMLFIKCTILNIPSPTIGKIIWRWKSPNMCASHMKIWVRKVYLGYVFLSVLTRVSVLLATSLTHLSKILCSRSTWIIPYPRVLCALLIICSPHVSLTRIHTPPDVCNYRDSKNVVHGKDPLVCGHVRDAVPWTYIYSGRCLLFVDQYFYYLSSHGVIWSERIQLQTQKDCPIRIVSN